MNNEMQLNARKKDLITTLNLREPTRVPIMLDVVTWPIDYANGKTDEWINHPNLMYEGYQKLYNDIPFDCITNAGIFMPLRALQTIGSEGWGISSDGITIQHMKQTCVMEDKDYDDFIADPVGTMTNNFAKKRFKNLTGTDEAIYEVLKEAVKHELKHQQSQNELMKITEEAGVVSLCSGGVRAPLDLLFSNVRGFNETLRDLYRRPEKVLEACESIMDVFGNPEVERIKKTGPLPLAQSGNHSPCFIGKKKYEKFFWPFYKKMVEEVVQVGGKIFNMLEGEGMFTLEYLRQLPKGTFLLRLDQDDPYEVQKKIGDWNAIACGITTAQLNYGTKQECIDTAKRCIDSFAPGGGYIFTTDKPLVCGKDVNPENLIAVYQFVHEYGVY